MYFRKVAWRHASVQWEHKTLLEGIYPTSNNHLGIKVLSCRSDGHLHQDIASSKVVDQPWILKVLKSQGGKSTREFPRTANSLHPASVDELLSCQPLVLPLLSLDCSPASWKRRWSQITSMWELSLFYWWATLSFWKSASKRFCVEVIAHSYNFRSYNG